MDGIIRLQLQQRARQLKALAAQADDERVRAKMEEVAREIEHFDEETARLFLSEKQSRPQMS